jgi:hypothetical protein
MVVRCCRAQQLRHVEWFRKLLSAPRWFVPMTCQRMCGLSTCRNAVLCVGYNGANARNMLSCVNHETGGDAQKEQHYVWLPAGLVRRRWEEQSREKREGQVRAVIAPHSTGRRKRKRASRRGERKRERQGGCNCNKVAATATPVHAGVHASVNAHASSRRAGASKRLAHWTATDVLLDCSSSRSPPAASPLPPAKPTTSLRTSSSRAVSCSSRKLPEVHIRVAEAYVGTDTRWTHIAEKRVRPWQRAGSPNTVSSANAM